MTTATPVGTIAGMASADRRSHTAGSRAGDPRIAAAVERLEVAVDRRPGFGRTTHAGTTTVVDGLRSRSEEGAWTIDADLPPGLGGSSSAPTPGALLRAALGSCLAMSYRLRAARRGVPVRAIRVTVETDSELDGMLRPTAAAPPGFTAIRCHVELDTEASIADIEALVDEADRLSPILDAIGRANLVCRSLSVTDGAD